MVGSHGSHKLPTGVVLTSIAVVVAACGGNGASAPADQPSPRAATSGLGIDANRRALAAKYLVIAEAGNRRLEADFDPLDKRDRSNLPRAQADLRDAAATERLFDRRLLRISFPPRIERVARELYRVNEVRAWLTTAAAGSTSLRRLHASETWLDAANGPVEQAVRRIRKDLGLPPPETS
jgi:hypothetical protein